MLGTTEAFWKANMHFLANDNTSLLGNRVPFLDLC